MKIQSSSLVPVLVEKTDSISSGAGKAKLQDLPEELIQHIQSLLPPPDAARTCLLSRSWAHAWSTFPILTFLKSFVWDHKKEERQYYNQIDRTLLRYHQHNIPIQSFSLRYGVSNDKLAVLAKKWIHLLFVSPNTRLKELSLVITLGIDSFTLPDEILYGQHLNKLSVTSCVRSLRICDINSNSAALLIRCVSLRVLDLTRVNISKQLLNNLLSTCCLLEKIKLVSCNGFKTIKFKDPPCFLRELEIVSGKEDVFLEVDDAPRLQSFHYYSSGSSSWSKPLPFNLDALRGCVTHLYVAGVFMDKSFFNTINLKFPFLESMTIGIKFPGKESFIITSASMKTLTIHVWVERSMDIQVYAPKLLALDFIGWRVPRNKLSISYPITPPGQVKLTVK
uniref:F-box/LRR-repeat protein At3g26922-like n=1 Tax=Erigeron canadensis TaxID=72917 RepID=UPI001CB97930|nr:F-box/LRR-repeat protein At3g26922-like [Erigeron canadensis]